MFKCNIKDMENIIKQGSSVGTKMEKGYKAQVDHGRIAEERTLRLIQDFLEGVDSAWLANKASVLDTNHKVDVVVEIDGQCIGIQVKTSEEGAQKHKDNEPFFRGKYGYPDVVVAGPHIPGWKVLEQLSEFTGLGTNKRLLDAMAYAHYYKGTVRDKLLFRRPGDIISLGLASPCPGGLRFIADPPPAPPPS